MRISVKKSPADIWSGLERNKKENWNAAIKFLVIVFTTFLAHTLNRDGQTHCFRFHSQLLLGEWINIWELYMWHIRSGDKWHRCSILTMLQSVTVLIKHVSRPVEYYQPITVVCHQPIIHQCQQKKSYKLKLFAWRQKQSKRQNDTTHVKYLMLNSVVCPHKVFSVYNIWILFNISDYVYEEKCNEDIIPPKLSFQCSKPFVEDPLPRTK